MDFERLLDEYRQAVRLLGDGGVREVHLMGIGGVGMAGLALLLRARGLRVSGCDLEDNRLTAALRAAGITVARGHDPAHCKPAVGWAVRSAAVAADHPEAEAFGRIVPVPRRGAVLPALLRGRRAIAVAGTHGKTTTTAFLAQILQATRQPFGFCIGGEVSALGGVAADGDGDCLFAVEADESDGTLALYEPATAVVTNVDFDHKENFADTAAFEDCFRRFIGRTRGCVIYGRDDAAARRLVGGHPRAVSFGLSADADYRGRIIEEEPGWMRFCVSVRGRSAGAARLPAPGAHNVLNALAALAAAAENGIGVETALRALAGVERPRRRFETIAACRGRRIVSDYAHHPTEIRALLRTARAERPRRILTVFQPHRYSRTLALGGEFPGAFEEADPLALLPVYAASEAPVEGGASFDLYKRFRERSPEQRVWLAKAAPQVEDWLQAVSIPGDLILIAGAGNVENIGLNLAKRWRCKPPPESADGVNDLRRRLLEATGLPAARARAAFPLARCTTMGVGGAADVYMGIESEEELSSLLAWTASGEVPVHVLGGGSNVLVSDLGVRGLVIRLEGRRFRELSPDGDGFVRAGAAVPLSRLAALSRAGGAAGGFGFLTGIPGTVGGAARMNAGAWGHSFGDRVVRIEGRDRRGRALVLEGADLRFDYRRGPAALADGVITAVLLRAAPPDSGEPARMREWRRGRAWCRGLPCAGSVFRNPAGGMAAGALLEAAGCKSLGVGGARVCREHANVIVCAAGARASDVMALMETMRARVGRHAGTWLEPEIVCWED